MLLSTRCRVEGRLVEYDDVPFASVFVVREDFKDGRVELVLFVVNEVEVHCLFDVRGLIEDMFGRLREFLLLKVHLVVEIIRLSNASDLLDGVRGHAP